MRSIIKGIILGIFLSIILSPITVKAKESISNRIASSMIDGIEKRNEICIMYGDTMVILSGDDYICLGTEPSNDSKQDVYTNYGKGWKFVEKELNEIGVYLDENGMIIDDTVYTMPKN